MREIYDLRISNEYVDRVLNPNEGVRKPTVTILKLDGTDSRLKKIENEFRKIKKRSGKSLLLGSIERLYSEQEFKGAAAFLLVISSVFQPEGEELGTKYDDAAACPKCGAGAPQLTPLYLPEKRIPKGKDISRTIAGEVVVSRKVKELFARHQITGARLNSVRYSAKSSAESSDWFQLILMDDSAEVAEPLSWIGLGLFQEDVNNEYRCPRGDTLGLNLISELFIDKASNLTSDVVGTRQFFGARQGVLRPERKIIISPRLRSLLVAEKVTGYKLEVVHLV